MSNSKSPPNNPPYKFAKGAALFSSLASLILLSIIIFTFKNHSFSSLFHSTKFWFFISNALILIIAADYNRVLSPNRNKRLDFYEDYIFTNPNQTQLLQSSSLEVVVDEEKQTPEEKLQIVVESRDFRSYQRSKSEKRKRKMMGRRLESVEYEAKGEENEFSKMTDEELNRRVEEFIQRFNRQMRLQTKSNGIGDRTRF